MGSYPTTYSTIRSLAKVSHKKRGYASDLNEKQWAILEPILRRSGPGRPMQLELRAVVNAIFYVLRSGCAWVYLPKEYPNYQSVYYHYHKWCWDETWEAITTALREQFRQQAKRKAQP